MPPPFPESHIFTLPTDPSLATFTTPIAKFLSTRPHYKYVCTGALVFSPHPTKSSSSTPTQPETKPATLTENHGSKTPETKVLLLRRAATDSWPLRWETPGGAVDNEDESILHGCIREVWEESGLLVNEVLGLVVSPASVSPHLRKPVVTNKMSNEDETGENKARTLDFEGGYPFITGSGNLVNKFSFLVTVKEGEVVLDENEHAEFVWAEEEECRNCAVVVDGEEKKIEFTSRIQREIVLEGFKMVKAGI